MASSPQEEEILNEALSWSNQRGAAGRVPRSRDSAEGTVSRDRSPGCKRVTKIKRNQRNNKKPRREQRTISGVMLFGVGRLGTRLYVRWPKR